MQHYTVTCSFCNKPFKIETISSDHQIGTCGDCIKLKIEIRRFVNNHLPQLEIPYYSHGIVHNKEIVALRKYREGSGIERNICDFYVTMRGYLPIKD